MEFFDQHISSLVLIWGKDSSHICLEWGSLEVKSTGPQQKPDVTGNREDIGVITGYARKPLQQTRKVKKKCAVWSARKISF